MDRLEKKFPNSRLVILQPCYNRGVEASAGTHDFDGVLDVQITNLDWGKAQSFLRGSGWAAWHRTPAQGFSDHIHMATIPPGLSGRPTAQQVGQAYAKLGIKVGKYIDGGWTTSDPHRITATCQVADYFAHAYGLANAHTSGSDNSWFPADIAATIYQPGAAREQAVAAAKTVSKVAGMFDQIQSIANQIIDATTSGTPNRKAAWQIREIIHDLEESQR
jgi:hypothetical protein